jgi:opacity protein-like surface antigen
MRPVEADHRHTQTLVLPKAFKRWVSTWFFNTDIVGVATNYFLNTAKIVYYSEVSNSRIKLSLTATAGSGFEFAWTDWISPFVEYRYTGYGDEWFPEDFGMGATPHSFALETQQIMAGISLQLGNWFGGGY